MYVLMKYCSKYRSCVIDIHHSLLHIIVTTYAKERVVYTSRAQFHTTSTRFKSCFCEGYPSRVSNFPHATEPLFDYEGTVSLHENLKSTLNLFRQVYWDVYRMVLGGNTYVNLCQNLNKAQSLDVSIALILSCLEKQSRRRRRPEGMGGGGRGILMSKIVLSGWFTDS